MSLSPADDGARFMSLILHDLAALDVDPSLIDVHRDATGDRLTFLRAGRLYARIAPAQDDPRYLTLKFFPTHPMNGKDQS